MFLVFSDGKRAEAEESGDQSLDDWLANYRTDGGKTKGNINCHIT